MILCLASQILELTRATPSGKTVRESNLTRA
jgi:hypothetical protein